MKYRNLKSGFTLIETLVYLALYALIMAGAVVSVYTIFESSAHNQTLAMLEEEGNYYMAKIDYAVSGSRKLVVVKDVNPPIDSDVLIATKYDGSTVTITLAGTNVTYQKNSGNVEVLNNTNVKVTVLSFEHLLASQDGIIPEGVRARATTTVTTSNGLTFERAFTTAKYLRK